MGLQDQLDERRAASSKRVPDDAKQIMAADLQRVLDEGIEAKTLKVGNKVANFELPNASGKTVKLEELLDKGPVVINFYRGVWCPYCNLELNAYQKHLSEIEELGARLVAISPQTPDSSLSAVEKNELKYEVLSDVGNKIAGQFGLVLQLSPALQELYTKFGINIPQHNGGESWDLPLPGTYVIDTDGTVKFAFALADYTQRAEPEDVISALREISK